MSTAPPGGNGTRRWIGFVGYASWANAAPVQTAAATRPPIKPFIVVLPFAAGVPPLLAGTVVRMPLGCKTHFAALVARP